MTNESRKRKRVPDEQDHQYEPPRKLRCLDEEQPYFDEHSDSYTPSDEILSETSWDQDFIDPVDTSTEDDEPLHTKCKPYNSSLKKEDYDEDPDYQPPAISCK